MPCSVRSMRPDTADHHAAAGGSYHQEKSLFRWVRRICFWGTGHLCNGNTGFLWNMVRAKIAGLAFRRGALPQTAYESRATIGRHLDAAGCDFPDDGARR